MTHDPIILQLTWPHHFISTAKVLTQERKIYLFCLNLLPVLTVVILKKKTPPTPKTWRNSGILPSVFPPEETIY